MLIWFVRIAFLLTIVSVAIGVMQSVSDTINPVALGAITALVPIGVFGSIVLAGVALIVVDARTHFKEIKTLSAVYFGLLLGLLLGSLVSSALIPILVPIKPGVSAENWPWGAPLRLLITAILCYICVSTLVQTKDDFRFLIPYVEFAKQVKGGKPLVLDTSVIIDGRIADVCDTRIIDTRLVVPRFVLQELQSVADSPDKLKRNRGRRGLDMLKRMQSNPKIELEMYEANLPELQEVREVDQRLVLLAKALGGRVVTNDFNLNRVAQLQGVEVINLNELANAMKSVALPGETMVVKLIKPGDQLGQGVGYLDDGTMVVAEHGRSFIGQEVQLTVTSVLQNPAGRMVFGRVDGKPPGAGNKDVKEGGTP